MRAYDLTISGSLLISGSGKFGDGSPIISSSGQLASDISGSFTQTSTSLASRISTAETELDLNLVSGSAQVKALLPTKTVSSSAQIASDISGSFTTLSASVSTRLAAEEAEAEGTVVSSSAQIAIDISGSLGTNATLIRSLTATGISGSFISVSSSLASRIAAEEAEAEGTVVSSSAQIAIDISGSLGANASLIRSLTAGKISGSFNKSAVSASFALKSTISGSLGTNATLIRGLTTGKISGSLGANATLIRGLTTGKISGSLGANATLIRSLTAAGISGSVVAGVSGSAVSTGSFGKLEVGGNSTLTGKLTVGGRITAQEFHTEFVSSSIVFQSGSTKFGDSAADTHTFTGQLEVSGSQAKVSASVGSTGSFGSIYVDKNVNASAFVGDGSSLTGIDIPTAAAISGSIVGGVSGSAASTGSFGSIYVGKNVNATSFVGDGSSLTGIDIPTAAAISGSIVGGVSGSSTSTGSFGSVYTRGVGSSSFHTILPAADDTYDLGSAALQWKDIYTGDFHLNNTSREEGNVIDGTKGNWTIQEGREDLYLLNNETGKKYKFNLTEIE
jgi:hypothetical protein